MSTCPEHPSIELEFQSGDYYTGVVAPDGYRERQYGEGFYCYECNYVWDESDLIKVEESENDDDDN